MNLISAAAAPFSSGVKILAQWTKAKTSPFLIHFVLYILAAGYMKDPEIAIETRTAQKAKQFIQFANSKVPPLLAVCSGEPAKPPRQQGQKIEILLHIGPVTSKQIEAPGLGPKPQRDNEITAGLTAAGLNLKPARRGPWL